MRKKQEITIFLTIFFIILAVLFVVSCGSFEITYAPPQRKPVKEAPAKKPAKEPIPSEEVAEKTEPSEKTAEEPAPPQTDIEEPLPAETTTEEPAPAETAAEEPAPAETAAEEPLPSQEIVKTTEDAAPPKKTSEEYVIECTVKINKKNYFAYNSKSGILYRLVGLKKEEKTRLYQLEGTLVNLEIRVVSKESAKAWNVQLIKIIDESISEEKIAESTPLEKKTTEKKAQEEKIAKGTPPEKDEAEEKATSEETQPEEISIEGVVNIDKNHYYISDPESGIQYKLIGLNKKEIKRLKKMKGKTVNLELKVVSTESENTFNAQLVRFL
ncbi:MAG: hypothetical protein KAT88_09960 [Spirochaetes bacterium]|nr:hypothetical protein [Spirochaetota bacterium]